MRGGGATRPVEEDGGERRQSRRGVEVAGDEGKSQRRVLSGIEDEVTEVVVRSLSSGEGRCCRITILAS